MSHQTPQLPVKEMNSQNQQWQQLLTQFATFKTQFNDQQQLCQSLQQKITHLESQSTFQHEQLLSQYEIDLEKYFYQIENSQDDIFIQHQLDLMNLIAVNIYNVDYRGAALRDLFKLRRNQIPSTITTLTVQSLITWLQKRLKVTSANTNLYTYYHTLLKATHYDHPIMEKINLTTLCLNPTYFPSSLQLFSPLPPTPIEYHRFLIAIAYDLDYCEASLLPLITHFGLPIVFPPIPMNVHTSLTPINDTPTPSTQSTPSQQSQLTTTTPSSTTTTTRPTQSKSLSIDPNMVSKSFTPLTTPSSIQSTPLSTDPFFYLGYSTHIPCLLYAPLWFGVLSRSSFLPDILKPTTIISTSFISQRWFSTLCRFGYLFDQIVRILTQFPLEGLYPSHQAYSMILPRFFSGEEPLTDPITYPSFGNKGFSKLYAFLLFIGAHLAMTCCTMENATSTVTSTSSSSPNTTSSTTNLKTPTNSNNNSSSFPLSTPTHNQHNQDKNQHQQSSQPTQPITIDTITYPVIRELYNASIKGSLDCVSLSMVLKSTELYQHLTMNERNKSNFTRLFGIFHFKILSGYVPSWLAKPLLGMPKAWKSGSVFEPLCQLGSVEHLSRYFDKNYTNCCDKRTAVDKISK